MVAPHYDNFGSLADLSLSLCWEKNREAIPLVDKYPMHFHIGNCIMRDWRHPLYGDLQPRFNIADGEIWTKDVRIISDFDRKLLRPENKPVMSVEVRPLLYQESSAAIIAQAKGSSKPPGPKFNCF